LVVGQRHKTPSTLPAKTVSSFFLSTDPQSPTPKHQLPSDSLPSIQSTAYLALLHGIGHFSNNFQTTLPTSNMFSKSMTVLLAAVAVTGTNAFDLFPRQAATVTITETVVPSGCTAVVSSSTSAVSVPSSTTTVAVTSASVTPGSPNTPVTSGATTEVGTGTVPTPVTGAASTETGETSAAASSTEAGSVPATSAGSATPSASASSTIVPSNGGSAIEMNSALAALVAAGVFVALA
ncbi:hypothetical protein HDK64DRAFT_16956, partial [Phyllosticta capitalensis]